MKTVGQILVLLFCGFDMLGAGGGAYAAIAARRSQPNISVDIPQADQIRPELPARFLHVSPIAPFGLRCDWIDRNCRQSRYRLAASWWRVNPRNL